MMRNIKTAGRGLPDAAGALLIVVVTEIVSRSA